MDMFSKVYRYVYVDTDMFMRWRWKCCCALLPQKKEMVIEFKGFNKTTPFHALFFPSWKGVEG
jgi:hypothetical protein